MNSRTLISLDTCCQYIPLFSCFVAAANTVQRLLYPNHIQPTPRYQPYIRHVLDKSSCRVAATACPLIGNAGLVCYDIHHNCAPCSSRPLLDSRGALPVVRLLSPQNILSETPSAAVSPQEPPPPSFSAFSCTSPSPRNSRTLVSQGRRDLSEGEGLKRVDSLSHFPSFLSNTLTQGTSPHSPSPKEKTTPPAPGLPKSEAISKEVEGGGSTSSQPSPLSKNRASSPSQPYTPTLPPQVRVFPRSSSEEVMPPSPSPQGGCPKLFSPTLSPQSDPVPESIFSPPSSLLLSPSCNVPSVIPGNRHSVIPKSGTAFYPTTPTTTPSSCSVLHPSYPHQKRKESRNEKTCCFDTPYGKVILAPKSSSHQRSCILLSSVNSALSFLAFTDSSVLSKEETIAEILEENHATYRGDLSQIIDTYREKRLLELTDWLSEKATFPVEADRDQVRVVDKGVLTANLGEGEFFCTLVRWIQANEKIEGVLFLAENAILSLRKCDKEVWEFLDLVHPYLFLNKIGIDNNADSATYICQCSQLEQVVAYLRARLCMPVQDPPDTPSEGTIYAFRKAEV